MLSRCFCGLSVSSENKYRVLRHKMKKIKSLMLVAIALLAISYAESDGELLDDIDNMIGKNITKPGQVSLKNVNAKCHRHLKSTLSQFMKKIDQHIGRVSRQLLIRYTVIFLALSKALLLQRNEKCFQALQITLGVCISKRFLFRYEEEKM